MGGALGREVWLPKGGTSAVDNDNNTVNRGAIVPYLEVESCRIMSTSDDIGCFGLPVASTSATQRTGNNENDAPVRSSRDLFSVLINDHTSLRGRCYNSKDFESSDEEEEVPLAQLARPASATAPSLSKRSAPQTQKTNKGDTRGSTKPAKQLGLHSFLTKKATKKSQSSDGSKHSSTENSAKISSDGGNDNMMVTTSSSFSSMDSSARKKRPHSFITAATLAYDIQQSNQQHRSLASQKGRKEEESQDELEEFSDDESNKQYNNDITVKADNATPNEEGTEIDTAEKVTFNESEADRVSKTRKKHNSIEFGVHSCIFGHKLPMGQSSKSKQQLLLHGKSGVNIISHIFQRSCLSYTSQHLSNAKRLVHSGSHWNLSDTVEFATSSNGTLTSGEVCAMAFDREGVLLATGDDRGCVQIYDFDDVAYLDMKKRNERCRLLLMEGVEVQTTKRVKESEAEATPLKDESIDLLDEEGDSTEADDNVEDLGLHPPPITPALARPVLSFQCKARPGGNVGPRISSVQWCPQNQDYLAVSFA